MPSIISGIIFVVGLLSYYWFFFVEYGAIVTVIITFLCGLFGGAIALGTKKRKLVTMHALLILSPYLLLLVIKIF
ncbi:hypothetical protein GLW00_12105 [Halobacillus litoralis]|uniref:Uncharacterized protein n=1 Tax=Halobacillus litoralis TaxID=45668 RepID=A0A845FCN4_9BACI|nr:hypothetical protein [Halobacillus litoralis]MYL71601.1 hypothetical protein [Halobacillus litoralis]